MNKRITVLAGDGIGPEIVPQALAVLQAIAKRFHHEFECVDGLVGGHATDVKGMPLPTETLEMAKSSDAVLLGAVGGPKWENLEYALRPERALLGLREQLGLFANLRPAKLYSELADASTSSICASSVAWLTRRYGWAKRGRQLTVTLQYAQRKRRTQNATALPHESVVPRS